MKTIILLATAMIASAAIANENPIENSLVGNKVQFKELKTHSLISAKKSDGYCRTNLLQGSVLPEKFTDTQSSESETFMNNNKSMIEASKFSINKSFVNVKQIPLASGYFNAGAVIGEFNFEFVGTVNGEKVVGYTYCRLESDSTSYKVATMQNNLETIFKSFKVESENNELTNAREYKNLAKKVVVSLYQRKGDTVSVTEVPSKEENVMKFDVSLTNASKADSAVYSVRIEGRAEKGDDVNISISLVPAGE